MAYLLDFCTGGTPSSDGDFSGSYPSSSAFDDSTASFWCSNAGVPSWIQYDLGLGKGKAARQYKLTARGPVSYNPWDAWTFAGSNNGVDFTTIDTQTGQSWTGGEVKTFNAFVNTTTYRYYRFTITTASTNYAEMAEIELIEWDYPPACYLHAGRDRFNMKAISTQNSI